MTIDGCVYYFHGDNNNYNDNINNNNNINDSGDTEDAVDRQLMESRDRLD